MLSDFKRIITLVFEHHFLVNQIKNQLWHYCPDFEYLKEWIDFNIGSNISSVRNFLLMNGKNFPQNQIQLCFSREDVFQQLCEFLRHEKIDCVSPSNLNIKFYVFSALKQKIAGQKAIYKQIFMFKKRYEIMELFLEVKNRQNYYISKESLIKTLQIEKQIANFFVEKVQPGGKIYIQDLCLFFKLKPEQIEKYTKFFKDFLLKQTNDSNQSIEKKIGKYFIYLLVYLKQIHQIQSQLIEKGEYSYVNCFQFLCSSSQKCVSSLELVSLLKNHNEKHNLKEVQFFIKKYSKNLHSFNYCSFKQMMKPATQLYIGVLGNRQNRNLELDTDDQKKILKLISLKISMMNTLTLKKLSANVKLSDFLTQFLKIENGLLKFENLVYFIQKITKSKLKDIQIMLLSTYFGGQEFIRVLDFIIELTIP